MDPHIGICDEKIIIIPPKALQDYAQAVARVLPSLQKIKANDKHLVHGHGLLKFCILETQLGHTVVSATYNTKIEIQSKPIIWKKNLQVQCKICVKQGKSSYAIHHLYFFIVAVLL